MCEKDIFNILFYYHCEMIFFTQNFTKISDVIFGIQMSIFFRSEKKNDQAYCHSFPEYIQYGSCRCHTVYANSIAGFPEYYTVYNIRLFLLFELFLINSKKIIHLKNTKQQRRAHTITVLLFYTQYIFTTQCKIIKNINIYIFT